MAFLHMKQGNENNFLQFFRHYFIAIFISKLLHFLRLFHFFLLSMPTKSQGWTVAKNSFVKFVESNAQNKTLYDTKDFVHVNPVGH